MALMYSEPAALGSPAPDFTLPGVDGKTYRLLDFKDSKALLVIFMCNHCPYVKAVQGRINALARQYGSKGISVVGINPNDSVRYPDDSFEAMKQTASENGYVFPYLRDEDQSVARAYGAICTPEFYLYQPKGNQFILRYRGRLDDNWKDEKAVTRRDLVQAIENVIAGREPAVDQPASMGCSIKWK
ncbi:MAG: alkyl hydroperoxide reductase [Bdellovibrionales bacterium GWB1_55_8]|nr:MAG: alkyl hydroperoxide reductase [Bdellovibrionales bacterium GWB1_55_8]